MSERTSTQPFLVTVPEHKEAVQPGWGVLVTPVWSGEGGDHVEKIDVCVIEISAATVDAEPTFDEHGSVALFVRSDPQNGGSGFPVPVDAFRICEPSFLAPWVPQPLRWSEDDAPLGYGPYGLPAGDTHDLRSWLFATKEEAEDYAEFVTQRWANPASWEVFVKL